VLGTALLLLIAWFLGKALYAPAPQHPREKASVPKPERVVPHATAPERVATKPAKRPALHVAGATPFLRRIAAGSHLQALSKELGEATADRAAMRVDYRTMKRYLLLADGTPPAPLADALHFLTRPRRDRDALVAQHGRRGLVRVWTLKQRYDAQALERAEMLMSQLAAESAHPMAQGVDVLVTPQMGRDVFPRQWSAPGAAGIYFLGDRYCVVRSTLPPEFLEQVLRHELVHAYTIGPGGMRAAPRFVAEGMAEYLRFLRPYDGGLKIPPAAFRDNLANLAWFIANAEKFGFDFSRVNPRAIVHLKPWDFYRLPMGYALALAMHAYVGGEPIAQALRARSPDPLIEALESVDFADFRLWLKRHSAGGDPQAARFVRDFTPTERAKTPTDWVSLRSIGATRSGTKRALAEAATEAMSSPERINEVIRLMLEPGGDPIVIITDLSRGMDGTLGPIPFPRAWEKTKLAKLSPTTPRDLMRGIHEVLGQVKGAATTVVGFTVDISTREDIRVRAPYTVDRAPTLMEQVAAHRFRLVVCSAARATKRSARRLEQLRDLVPASTVALVIDVSHRGRGDAALFAKLLAERGFGLNVAYWKP